MTVVLGQLRCAAPGPDQFADPPGRPPVSGLALEEFTPDRNEPGWITANGVDVGEAHSLGVASQGLLEQSDPVIADSYEQRLLGCQGAIDKWQRAPEEFILAGVEEGLVVKGALSLLPRALGVQGGVVDLAYVTHGMEGTRPAHVSSMPCNAADTEQARAGRTLELRSTVAGISSRVV